jgi:hypothetical protein
VQPDCDRTLPTTPDRNALFKHNNDVRENEVAMYYIEAIEGYPARGCAGHPPGTYGGALTRLADRLTLPHEIGHVVGLKHVVGPHFMTNLMWAHTDQITQIPPAMMDWQAQVFRDSPTTSPW